MMKKSFLFLRLLPLIALIATLSCRKDDLISNDTSITLSFSTDSVVFDTVFTSIGTVTKRLMVYNSSNKRINISNIQLGLAEASVFRVNVDGVSGLNIDNIEVAAKDSVFILVKATIDPRDESNPYVVEDDLIFLTNGNQQKVKLVAWGQDANYIIADQVVGNFPKFRIVADSNETVYWTSEKPYVVYGYALINSYGTLIIEAGTKVHFHDKSGLWAYVDGVLKVQGTLENPVTFQGDRLDQEYKDIPGQWDRIWLMEGRAGFNHEIDHAIIRNGYIGLQVESFLRATSNQLTISNTVIENHSGYGFLGRYFAVDASNLVLANCGLFAAKIESGGAYSFRHCSIVNEWKFGVRNSPALYFHNAGLDADSNIVAVPLDIRLANTIIYGSSENEIERDLLAGADTNYVFDHCLLRLKDNWKNEAAFINCILNEDPLFRDYDAFNYEPDTLSPVIGKGKPEISAEIPFDLNGVSRLTSSDIGAFQYVPDPEEE